MKTAKEWADDPARREITMEAYVRAIQSDALEEAAKVADTLSFQQLTEIDEQKYLDIHCSGHEIPMAFHADRIAGATRALIKEQL